MLIPEQKTELKKQLMSNPKFASALQEFGVDPPRKISKTTGKESWAFAKTDPGLQELLEHPNPSVQALVAARLEVKSTIEETRSLKYLEAAKYGPWPMHYHYSGAMQTHRLSGGSGAGGNPQNLKRGGQLRKAIKAPPGYNLVVGDLAQIELRVCMALAGEIKEIEALRSGEDPYIDFASVIYNKPINKKDHPLERQVSKAAKLGLQFGMGWKRFLEECRKVGLPMDEDTAKKIVALYRATYPGIPALWKQADRILLALSRGETGTWGKMRYGVSPVTNAPGLCSPAGLWITYPELRWEDGDNPGWTFLSQGKRVPVWGGTVVENEVQHLARCIMVPAILLVDKYFPVVLSSHDEIGCLTLIKYVEKAVELLTKAMSKPPVWWPEIPLAVEVKYGTCYGEIK